MSSSGRDSWKTEIEINSKITNNPTGIRTISHYPKGGCGGGPRKVEVEPTHGLTARQKGRGGWMEIIKLFEKKAEKCRCFSLSEAEMYRYALLSDPTTSVHHSWQTFLGGSFFYIILLKKKKWGVSYLIDCNCCWEKLKQTKNPSALGQSKIEIYSPRLWQVCNNCYLLYFSKNKNSMYLTRSIKPMWTEM